MELTGLTEEKITHHNLPKRRIIVARERKVQVLADALVENYPWTSNTIAEELGMNLATFRVWKNKIEKEEKIKRPAAPSLLCIQDPESKNKLRYSDEYLGKLKEVRNKTPRRASRNGMTHSTSDLKHALVKITVPIFDKTIADFVLKKFKDQRGVEEHLKDHLRALATPTLNKMEELKKRFEKEMQELMSNS